MDLFEEHPVLALPLREEMESLGEEEAVKVCRERCDMIERERVDPLRYGYRPEVWDVCDDLLVDGHMVILGVERVGRAGVGVLRTRRGRVGRSSSRWCGSICLWRCGGCVVGRGNGGRGVKRTWGTT